ncbi:flagellar biosynthesis protein FlgH [Cardiobacteriaceae bacterium TAE3-ERU3]|nr:flagellar biosynthesis protein FlgH [Cardiobacteriaceae bacterium TAE3-ERU3]
MFKTVLVLSVVVAVAGCANQPPPSGVPLAAQSTPAPAYSPLDQPSLLPASHQRYSQQRNPLEGAAYGSMIGGGLGQVVGQDTESTVYGAAAGALIGYGTNR